MKKLISILLSVLMIIAVFTSTGINISVSAEETEVNGLSDFGYTINNNEVSIDKYTGTETGELIIPDSIEGYPVTMIGDWVFRRKKFTSIKIPNTLKIVGNNVFVECNSITAVDIPEGVTSIGKGSFSECEKLKEVFLPSSVTKIGELAFTECPQMEKVVVNKENTVYSSCSDLVIENGTKIIFGAAKSTEEFIVPDTVTRIGAYALSYMNRSIVMPESINLIAAYSFYDAEIPELTINHDNLVIGEKAFFSATIRKFNLRGKGITLKKQAFDNTSMSVYIDSLESLFSLEAESSEAAMFFSNNSTLYVNNECVTVLEIPEGYTNVSDYSFYGCEQIREIKFPKSLKSIGKYAFAATSITELNLPENLETIGDSAFYFATKLSGKLVLPDSVVEIGQCAFLYAKITEVKFPENLKVIEKYAFKETSLEGKLVFPDNLQKIEDQAFSKTNISEIVFPESLESIGKGAFMSSELLTKVEMKNGLKTIGEEAFYMCPNLKSVYIPYSVTEIGNAAVGHESVPIYWTDGHRTYGGFGPAPMDDFVTYYSSEAGQAFSAGNKVFVLTPENHRYVYFKPNETWSEGKVKFSAKFTDKNGKGVWVPMYAVGKGVRFKAKVPQGLWTSVVFSRMDGNSAGNSDEYQLNSSKSYNFDYNFNLFEMTESAEILATGTWTQFIQIKKIGDVDEDERVSVRDVSSIQRYLAEIVEFDSIEYECADVNEDGTVDINDVTMIQKHLARMITIE